ncbi:MAG: hypothetical protein M1128_00220 [Candidatus Marsarchaeota archaeon]|nr:hypothetical protein [Candidatus Marsarchaeota archaeon]
MAIDPEDMLIFKVREDKGELPKPSNAKPRAANPSTTAAPKKKVQARDEAKIGTIVQAQKTNAATFNPAAVNSSVGYVSNASSYREVADALITEGENVNDYIGHGAKSGETRFETESKEAAIGLSCVWHPWRPAYAICSSCHRPFCFEDIVERNGRYYCLEDVDKAEPAKELENVTYNRLGIISAVMFSAAFVAFLLLGSSQLGYVINFANKLGFFTFISNIKFDYMFPIIAAIVAFFELITGFMILMQARKGFVIGIISGFVAVALFTYQFLATTTFYLLIIDILTFAGVFSLVYSRTIDTVASDVLLGAESAPAPMEFANVGRF